MATIKEIAKRAGVSVGTVDRVIHNRGDVNEQTKKLVEEIIKELNYQPNSVARALAIKKKKLKILFYILEHKDHIFFGDVYEAALNRAKELEDFGVQVDFVELGADTKQWDMHLDEIKEYDGIISAMFESKQLLEMGQLANGLDIPIVCYNRDMIPEVKTIAYVGSDYKQAGRIAAGLSALIGGNDSKVCIFSEVYAGADVLAGKGFDRIEGFEEELAARYPAMFVVDKCLLYNDLSKNEIAIRDMLKNHPDVNVIYVDNPGNYSFCEALANIDKDHKIKLITHDLVGRQKQMLQDGIIDATIGQEPDVQGTMPLDIMFRYLAFGDNPKEHDYLTKQSIIISQNMPN